jgi:hypothetical protein
LDKYKALAVFTIAFVYYLLLAATEFTWIFGSGDSGGWLMAAVSWSTPQPLGNPIYVLFGHAMNALPGDLVAKMTIVGSCLASAITVTVVYLLTLRFTQSWKLGILSSGVLLASAVFLSQSTVLSQYPLAILATVSAFWFYLRGNRKLSVISLGLGTAMHVMVGTIAVLWIAMEWRQGRLREWLRFIPLFLLVGVTPYTLTLWELRMEHGSLGLDVLTNHISNTSGAGQLALTALPARILLFIGFMVVSLGAALLPIWHGVRRREVKGYWLMVVPIALVSWYYLSSLDPTIWHYLPWTMPFLAIFAGIGAAGLRGRDMLIVSEVVVLLLVANTMLLSANVEAERNPVATDLYRKYTELPHGSRVAVPRTGWLGFTLRYVQETTRPDLVLVPPARPTGKPVWVPSVVDGRAELGLAWPGRE